MGFWPRVFLLRTDPQRPDLGPLKYNAGEISGNSSARNAWRSPLATLLAVRTTTWELSGGAARVHGRWGGPSEAQT